MVIFFMDTSAQYGQMDFNLPHDVVELPSKGIFYKTKKSSLKIGYLTAMDENTLISNLKGDQIINNILRQKIYEPGFNVDELIDCDVQAILIFLRNTAFGPDYNVRLIDPKTKQEFEATVRLDELNVVDPIHTSTDGFFTTTLPKSQSTVKLKVLNQGHQKELDKFIASYPKGMNAHGVTKKLEMQFVEIDGDGNREKIATFIPQLPIADSKHIKNFLAECEPRLDLRRTAIAPSGDPVDFTIGFGAEFFRPFYS
jgi:hypothetical protein